MKWFKLKSTPLKKYTNCLLAPFLFTVNQISTLVTILSLPKNLVKTQQRGYVYDNKNNNYEFFILSHSNYLIQSRQQQQFKQISSSCPVVLKKPTPNAVETQPELLPVNVETTVNATLVLAVKLKNPTKKPKHVNATHACVVTTVNVSLND